MNFEYEMCPYIIVRWRHPATCFAEYTALDDSIIYSDTRANKTDEMTNDVLVNILQSGHGRNEHREWALAYPEPSSSATW